VIDHPERTRNISRLERFPRKAKATAEEALAHATRAFYASTESPMVLDYNRNWEIPARRGMYHMDMHFTR